MKRISQAIIVAAAFAFAQASQAADVRVNFAGTVSASNPGPLTPSADFSGSFIIDASVIPVVGGLTTWPGAVRDFEFSSADLLFSGDAGFYRQFGNAFIAGGFSNAGATLDGIVIDPDKGTFTLADVTWDWRTSFSPNDVIVSDKTRDDFSFVRLTLQFSNPDADAFDRASILGLSQLDFTIVPLPAAAWLFGGALLALVSLRRTRS